MVLSENLPGVYEKDLSGTLVGVPNVGVIAAGQLQRTNVRPSSNPFRDNRLGATHKSLQPLALLWTDTRSTHSKCRGPRTLSAEI